MALETFILEADYYIPKLKNVEHENVVACIQNEIPEVFALTMTPAYCRCHSKLE